MPYKDPETQKAAQHRQYLRNKERYKEAQRQRRAQPGYRDAEYARLRAIAAKERAERSPAPEQAPAPTPSFPEPLVVQAPRRAKQGPAAKPREVAPVHTSQAKPRKMTPKERELHERAQEYARVQREMKAAALERLS
jgi:hypothetical protein